MSTVHFDVTRPVTYDKIQILVRILGMMLLGVIGTTLGWVAGVAYIGLPVLAAVMISTSGAARYHEGFAPKLVTAFRWLLGVHAYFALLTDRFPLDSRSLSVRYEVEPSGAPTVGAALMHLVTSIPAALVMWILGCLSAIVWLIAAVAVLFNNTYPQSMFDFQRAVLRMYARFLAHHASLVPGAAPVAYDPGAEPERATFAA